MNPDSDARRLWDAALALNRAAAAVSPAVGRLPPLLFLTDGARTPDPWTTAGRLPAGAGVIFRTFGAPDAAENARRLRKTTAAATVTLLIALDADLAAEVGADGVHLPERVLADAPALRAAHPDWLITGAVHGSTAVNLSVLDAVILSPVFPAGGASARRPALGVAEFRTQAERLGQPAYALGGVNAATVADLARSGACGIAAVDAIRSGWG